MKTLLVLSFLQSLVLGEEYDHSSRNSYSYQYNVADPKTFNNFEVAESGDPEAVTGSYKVDLPDGRRQIVSYSVHPKQGYHAEVTYIGEAKYPDTPLYGATPYGPPEPIHRYGNPKFKRQLPKRKSIHFPFSAKKVTNKKKTSAPHESTVKALPVEKVTSEANNDLFAEPSEINYERPERTVVVIEKTDSAKEAGVQEPLKLVAVSLEENDSSNEDIHTETARVEYNSAVGNHEDEPEPLPEPLSLQAQAPVQGHSRVGKYIDWSNCKNLNDCLTSLEIVDDTKPSTKVKMTESTDGEHVEAGSEETQESELLEEFEVDVNDDLLSEIYKIEHTTAKRYSYNPTTRPPPPSSPTPVPASSSTVQIHTPSQEKLSPSRPRETQRKRNVGQDRKFSKVLYRTDVSRKPSTVETSYVYRPRYVAHYDTVLDVNKGRPDLKPVEFANVHPYEYPSHDGISQKTSSSFRKPFRENTFKSVVESEAEKALDTHHEDIDYFEDYSTFPFGARIESVVVPKLNQLPGEPISYPASSSYSPSASSTDEAESSSPAESSATAVMTTLVDDTVPTSTTTVAPTVTPVHRNKKVRLISKGNTFVPEYVPTF